MPDSVEDDGRFHPGDMFGPASATLAVAIFLWHATRPEGWLEAAFGPVLEVFWLGVILWTVACFLAIRRKQHWWVIASAPFALYPLFMVGTLLAACWQGNCL